MIILLEKLKLALYGPPQKIVLSPWRIIPRSTVNGNYGCRLSIIIVYGNQIRNCQAAAVLLSFSSLQPGNRVPGIIKFRQWITRASNGFCTRNEGYQFLCISFFIKYNNSGRQKMTLYLETPYQASQWFNVWSFSMIQEHA